MNNTAKNAVGYRGKGVKDLHECVDKHDARGDGDDFSVGGEYRSDLSSENHKEGDVDGADDEGANDTLIIVRSSCCKVGEEGEYIPLLRVTWAPSARPAPMRFATLVDVAIARGKGMLKEVDVTLTRILWAAN